jgi:hypothetical protein
MDRFRSWVGNKIIWRIILFSCVLAGIFVFSRLVDQAYEISPWIIKGVLAFMICALMYRSEAESEKRRRIEELEA